MALDLIKQYLVGIGFNVDSNSLKTAQESMAQADNTIKQFNNNSNKGFSETSSSLKDLFTLLGSSGEITTRLTASLGGPFKSLIKDIALVQKMYKNVVGDNKDKSKENVKEFAPNKDSIKDGLKDVAEGTSESLGKVEGAAKGLLSNGGKYLKTFASSAVGSFLIIGTAVIATIAAVTKLVSYLNSLAAQDIKYEKLSRQLWTTKENAKEVGTALDTLDANLQDLWLSPTLLKQFEQLRKDAKNLRLPPEFNQNIKVIQGIGLEFKRLKQNIGLLFQWIGNYILKYCAGPLDEVRGKAHSFNDWLVEHIPQIGKLIGTIIGVLLRILMIIGKIMSIVWKLTTPIRYVFKLIGTLGSAFDKIPEPVKKAVKTIVGILMLVLSPILLIIGLIDDIMTYFRGGKSVIGSFIDKIVSKSENAGKVIKSILSVIKAILTGGLSLVPWDNYWKKAKETFEKIKDKAKETWDKVKEWSEGKLEKAKEFIAGAKEKVEAFATSAINNTAASYVTSNNSTKTNNTTSNSHNNVNNKNTINVYGSDAKSTANAVSNNLIGISTRNLQEVF